MLRGARAWRVILIVVAGIFPALQSALVGAQTIGLDDFEIFVVDPLDHRISLHWNNRDNRPYGSLKAVKRALSDQGKTVLALMNAGIYDKQHRPLGLHVEDGQQLRPLDRHRGGGNFYLKPNGVFYIGKRGAEISRTAEFKLTKDIMLATQSGPLLFDRHGMHRAFVKNSRHRHYRNAIGVREDGHVVFVMSKKRVTFWQLAHFLRDQQKCITGLYLDGFISQFWQAGHKGPSGSNRFVGVLAVSQRRN